MKQINITVKDKIAETDFAEVVSFNGVYTLKFAFDEEWDDYSARVAVVKWDDGAREKLFMGTECEMPTVESDSAAFILIGVYSIKNGKRIASSFVRIRCEAGTGGFPQPKPVLSLHDQVLDLINEDHNVLDNALEIGDKTYNGSESVKVTAEDFGLAEVATSGSYNDLKDKPSFTSAVTSVNGQTGAVTLDKDTLGLGALAGKDTVSSEDIGTSAVLGYAIARRVIGSDHIAVDGVREDNIKDGVVTASKLAADVVKAGTGASVTRESGGAYTVAVSKADLVTSVNGKKGDVTIDADTMGLADVAFSGQFSDLVGAPESGVFSVNGQTGAVTIDKDSLGLGALAMKDTVTSDDIGSGAVLGYAIGRKAVGANNLALNAVTADAIKDGAVTGAKLAEGAITAGTGVSVSRDGGAFKVSVETTDLIPSVAGQPEDTRKGANYDTIFTGGFYFIEGVSGSPCTNAPSSVENTSPSNCSWFLLVISATDNSASVQVAFSARGDNAVRVRTYKSGAWGSWENIVV